MARQTKAERLLDQRIDVVYREHCSGMQISVLRIPELFRQAGAKFNAGETDAQVGAWMVEFVNAEGR